MKSGEGGGGDGGKGGIVGGGGGGDGGIGWTGGDDGGIAAWRALAYEAMRPGTSAKRARVSKRGGRQCGKLAGSSALDALSPATSPCAEAEVARDPRIDALAAAASAVASGVGPAVALDAMDGDSLTIASHTIELVAASKYLREKVEDALLTRFGQWDSTNDLIKQAIAVLSDKIEAGASPRHLA